MNGSPQRNSALDQLDRLINNLRSLRRRVELNQLTSDQEEKLHALLLRLQMVDMVTLEVKLDKEISDLSIRTLYMLASKLGVPYYTKYPNKQTLANTIANRLRGRDYREILHGNVDPSTCGLQTSGPTCGGSEEGLSEVAGSGGIRTPTFGIGIVDEGIPTL